MIIEVDVGHYLVVGVIAILATIFALLFFSLALKMRQVADRYRLKYGYDRQIEDKMFGKDPDKLDKREQYFKERTYRD